MCYDKFVKYKIPKTVEGYKAVFSVKKSLSLFNFFRERNDRYFSMHTGVEYKENFPIPKLYKNVEEAMKNIPYKLRKILIPDITEITRNKNYQGSGIFEDYKHCKGHFRNYNIIKIKGRAIGEADYFRDKIFLIDFIYSIEKT